MEWLKTQWRNVLLGLAALAAGVLLWFGLQQDRAPVNTAQIATPAPEVAHEDKAGVPVKFQSIQAYSNAAKAKLPIPAAAREKTQLKAVAASRVAADDHPNTITTLVDADTGATTTYVNREPMPFMALDTASEAALYYGWRNGVGALRVDVRQALFTVKSVHVGIIGSLDQPRGGATGTFLGVGVWVRW